MNKGPNLKTLFLAELKYQFTSPVRIFQKCIGILIGILILVTQIVSQKNPTAILAMTTMSIIIAVFSVEIGSIIQNMQSIDRLKTQFLIYSKQKVAFIRLLNEIINIIFTAFIMFIIVVISLVIKVDSYFLNNFVELAAKETFAVISFGILLIFIGTLASTIKASAKVRKIFASIICVIMYLLVLISFIAIPLVNNGILWIQNNEWILALPLVSTMLSGVFVFTTSLAWIYAFTSIIYVIIIIAFAFEYYALKIKKSIVEN